LTHDNPRKKHIGIVQEGDFLSPLFALVETYWVHHIGGLFVHPFLGVRIYDIIISDQKFYVCKYAQMIAQPSLWKRYKSCDCIMNHECLSWNTRTECTVLCLWHCYTYVLIWVEVHSVQAVLKDHLDDHGMFLNIIRKILELCESHAVPWCGTSTHTLYAWKKY